MRKWLGCLLAALAGCDGPHRSLLVRDEVPGQPVALPPTRLAKGEPAQEASALRAVKVAQKVMDANKDLGFRPTLLTVGGPTRSMFHNGHGGPSGGCSLYLTEGLINACKDEAQLAAAICTEMGRIAAERAATLEQMPIEDIRPTIDERIGHDARGYFGPADGTRVMEAAKREMEARKKPEKADPSALARRYMTKAGYSPEALGQVEALLKEADREEPLKEHFTAPADGARLLAPVPKKPG
ncbi:MAG: hypothetical protein K2W96_21080 [Gemmataceae bacterium]|nr:hypothetical protein [Gemmataceae bacterium]